MKNIAIIGTQGVPAKYGGFETMVENIIGENCGPEIQYTVFCSSKDFDNYPDVYKGAKLTYIPVHANGMQSTIYDSLSLIKAIRGYDVILVLGVSGGLFFPIFRLFCRKKLIVNMDGRECKRAKWGRFAKLFLRASEEVALYFSDVVVADNQGIVNYVKERYEKKTVLIAYGGNHVLRTLPEERHQAVLDSFHLKRKEYAITICRIEPENHCELILDVFARTGKTLVFVGNWEYSEYGRKLKTQYGRCTNIQIVDSLYDLEILYVLRHNCRTYVHGHSAGGTNPSLVEAMFCECHIVAYDVIYNRETTENKACYFKDGIDLALLTAGDQEVIDNADIMYKVARKRYQWTTIAKQYEALYNSGEI